MFLNHPASAVQMAELRNQDQFDQARRARLHPGHTPLLAPLLRRIGVRPVVTAAVRQYRLAVAPAVAQRTI
jgi:hypothetical protein